MAKINRTVKRALDILQLLQTQKKPLTITEISGLLDIPATSAFDIVQTLLSEGFVEQAEAGRKAYEIGAKTFEVGASYLRNTDTVQIVSPYVRELMQVSNSTAFFAIQHGYQIIYLYKSEAPTFLRTTAELGSRRNMYSTGLGKAILACYDENRIREIFFDSPIEAYTPNTITDIDPLLDDLHAIHERGYAIDNQESDLNIICVACAIRDYTGSPAGAISIASMASTMTDEVIQRYGSITANYAREISKKLGWSDTIYD